MKVLGFTVTAEVESACIERMRSGWFTAAQLSDVVERAAKLSGHSDIAYLVADRLIQRERKAGNIRRVNNGWLWKS